MPPLAAEVADALRTTFSLGPELTLEECLAHIFGPKQGECNKQWETGTLSYRCLDCQKFSGVAYCTECFKGGGHDEHNYIMYISSSGGSCDCGFDSRTNPDFFCKEHAVKPVDPAAVERVLAAPGMSNVLSLLQEALLSYADEHDANLCTSLCILAEVHWGMKHLLYRAILALKESDEQADVLRTYFVIARDSRFTDPIVSLLVSLITLEDVKKEISAIFLENYRSIFCGDYEYTSDFCNEYSRVSINIFACPSKTFTAASLGALRVLAHTTQTLIETQCNAGPHPHLTNFAKSETPSPFQPLSVANLDSLFRLWSIADDMKNYFHSEESVCHDFITNVAGFSAMYSAMALVEKCDVIKRAVSDFLEDPINDYHRAWVFFDASFHSISLVLYCYIHKNAAAVAQLQDPSSSLSTALHENARRCLQAWAETNHVQPHRAEPEVPKRIDVDRDCVPGANQATEYSARDDQSSENAAKFDGAADGSQGRQEGEYYSTILPLHCQLAVLLGAIARYHGQEAVMSILREFVAQEATPFTSVKQLLRCLCEWPLNAFAAQARVIAGYWVRNGSCPLLMLRNFGSNRTPIVSMGLLFLIQLYLSVCEPSDAVDAIKWKFFRTDCQNLASIDNTDRIRLTTIYEHYQLFLLALVQSNPMVTGDIQGHVDTHVLSAITFEPCGMSAVSLQAGYTEDYMRSWVDISQSLRRFSTFQPGKITGNHMSEGLFLLDPKCVATLNWARLRLTASNSTTFNTIVKNVYLGKRGYEAACLFSVVEDVSRAPDLSRFCRELHVLATNEAYHALVEAPLLSKVTHGDETSPPSTTARAENNEAWTKEPVTDTGPKLCGMSSSGGGHVNLNTVLEAVSPSPVMIGNWMSLFATSLRAHTTLQPTSLAQTTPTTTSSTASSSTAQPARSMPLAAVGNSPTQASQPSPSSLPLDHVRIITKAIHNDFRVCASEDSRAFFSFLSSEMHVPAEVLGTSEEKKKAESTKKAAQRRAKRKQQLLAKAYNRQQAMFKLELDKVCLDTSSDDEDEAEEDDGNGTDKDGDGDTYGHGLMHYADSEEDSIGQAASLVEKVQPPSLQEVCYVCQGKIKNVQEKVSIYSTPTRKRDPPPDAPVTLSRTTRMTTVRSQAAMLHCVCQHYMHKRCAPVIRRGFYRKCPICGFLGSEYSPATLVPDCIENYHTVPYDPTSIPHPIALAFSNAQLSKPRPGWAGSSPCEERSVKWIEDTVSFVRTAMLTFKADTVPVKGSYSLRADLTQLICSTSSRFHATAPHQAIHSIAQWLRGTGFSSPVHLSPMAFAARFLRDCGAVWPLSVLFPRKSARSDSRAGAVDGLDKAESPSQAGQDEGKSFDFSSIFPVVVAHAVMRGLWMCTASHVLPVHDMTRLHEVGVVAIGTEVDGLSITEHGPRISFHLVKKATVTASLASSQEAVPSTLASFTRTYCLFLNGESLFLSFEGCSSASAPAEWIGARMYRFNAPILRTAIEYARTLPYDKPTARERLEKIQNTLFPAIDKNSSSKKGVCSSPQTKSSDADMSTATATSSSPSSSTSTCARVTAAQESAVAESNSSSAPGRELGEDDHSSAPVPPVSFRQRSGSSGSNVREGSSKRRGRTTSASKSGCSSRSSSQGRVDGVSVEGLFPNENFQERFRSRTRRGATSPHTKSPKLTSSSQRLSPRLSPLARDVRTARTMSTSPSRRSSMSALTSSMGRGSWQQTAAEDDRRGQGESYKAILAKAFSEETESLLADDDNALSQRARRSLEMSAKGVYGSHGNIAELGHKEQRRRTASMSSDSHKPKASSMTASPSSSSSSSSLKSAMRSMTTSTSASAIAQLMSVGSKEARGNDSDRGSRNAPLARRGSGDHCEDIGGNLSSDDDDETPQGDAADHKIESRGEEEARVRGRKQISGSRGSLGDLPTPSLLTPSSRSTDRGLPVAQRLTKNRNSAKDKIPELSDASIRSLPLQLLMYGIQRAVSTLSGPHFEPGSQPQGEDAGGTQRKEACSRDMMDEGEDASSESGDSEGAEIETTWHHLLRRLDSRDADDDEDVDGDAGERGDEEANVAVRSRSGDREHGHDVGIHGSSSSMSNNNSNSGNTTSNTGNRAALVREQQTGQASPSTLLSSRFRRMFGGKKVAKVTEAGAQREDHDTSDDGHDNEADSANDIGDEDGGEDRRGDGDCDDDGGGSRERKGNGQRGLRKRRDPSVLRPKPARKHRHLRRCDSLATYDLHDILREHAGAFTDVPKAICDAFDPKIILACVAEALSTWVVIQAAMTCETVHLQTCETTEEMVALCMESLRITGLFEIQDVMSLEKVSELLPRLASPESLILWLHEAAEYLIPSLANTALKKEVMCLAPPICFKPLPSTYSELYLMLTVRDSNDTRDLHLCLRCGERFTVNEEINEHSKRCCEVFLEVHSTLVVIVNQNTVKVKWGSLYLDEYDEEDFQMKRGNKLMLSQERFELLQRQWLMHIIPAM